jgi:outer membrane lipoprotein LolB
MRTPNLARARAGSLCLIGALLAGCATLAPTTDPSIPAATAQAPLPVPVRAYHDSIDIAGRMSLRYEQNGSPQSLDGKFVWAQSGNRTRITLLTPFGQTLATIDVAPGQSTLTQADRPPRSEADVDGLIASTLGWPLPVAGLRDWLQGFAASDQGARYVADADAAGDAAYVKTANGWLIHYPVWDAPSSGGMESRPKRIDLQRRTSQAGDVSLRLVIDQWQPH